MPVRHHSHPTIPPSANGQSGQAADRAALTAGTASPLPGNEYKDLPLLAREPDLMATIREDGATVGLVGEQDNAALLYTVGTSRLLPEPLAAMLRGPSSAGKSTLIRKTAQLFPAGCKVEAMEMTPAAWFRTEEYHFFHKLFIAGERRHATTDEAKDAGRFLRQLLSEGKLNRGVGVLNPKTNEWVTKWIERPGPVAYMESTTAEHPFAEDLNRMLQLYVDDSDAQSRRVVEGIFGSVEPGRQPANTEAVIKRHHEFQGWLQALPRLPVGIPYARALGQLMPVSGPASRRAAEQLRGVIQTVAMLHTNRREVQNGWLIASLEDYHHARTLLLPVMEASFGIGEKDCARLNLMHDTFKSNSFTLKNVKWLLKMDNDMGPYRVVTKFVAKELVRELTPHSGRTAGTYLVTPGACADHLVLPTVEALSTAVRDFV